VVQPMWGNLATRPPIKKIGHFLYRTKTFQKESDSQYIFTNMFNKVL